MPLSPLSRNVPVTDKEFRPLQVLQLFSEDVSRLPPLIGTGSPEGIFEARQGRLYMNDAGTPGSILYIKRDDDIAGDRTMGWILV